MQYKNIVRGTFISRPNRFTANVKIGDNIEICHVKNTGRCGEIFIPGTEVFLEKSDNPLRKTAYDLVAAYKGDMLINTDSQAPNKVFGEWIQQSRFFSDAVFVKPEKTYKNSRFDYYVETNIEQIFIEVKGVTLENDGIASFPDAPTERGVKHILELCDCVQNGFRAYIFFIVQLHPVKYFTPNRIRHPQFADALAYAASAGVNIKCLSCNVTPDSLTVRDFVDVKLG